MNSHVKIAETGRMNTVAASVDHARAESLITTLFQQEPIGFMLRSFYKSRSGKGGLVRKILKVIDGQAASKEKELWGSLVSAVSSLPRDASFMEDETVFALLMELQKEKIKECLEPERKTIAVYFPDGAYRGQTGGILNKLRSAHYNALTFVGTICNDEHEKSRNVFYGGHGIIEHMDCVDLFVCATYAHDLPPSAKKVYFMHDIHDSPVSKEDEVLKMILNYDYYFLPSLPVLERVKKQIRDAGARGFLNEKKEIGLIPGGYIKLDRNLQLFKKYQKEDKVLIHAPTVADSDIENYACLPRHSEKIIGALLKHFPDYTVIFRPHPHTVNIPPVRRIVNQYRDNPRFLFDDNASFYMSNYARSALMVTDFSGTAFTYAFTTLRPVVFFSHNEEAFQKRFADFKFAQDRDKVGRVARNTGEMIQCVEALLKQKKNFESAIKGYRDSQIYNLRHAESYFVKHIDFILNGQKQSDWDYLQVRPLLPKLVEEGYQGFNVVRFKNKWFALSQELGQIDLENMSLSELGLDSKCFVGSSEREVKGYVDGMITAQELMEQSQAKSREIESLQNHIADREQKAKGLLAELGIKAGLLEQLMSEVNRLDEKVVTLIGEMEGSRRQTEALKEEATDRKIKIENLMSGVEEREARIEALIDEMDARTLKEEALSRELELRDKWIQLLRGKIRDTASQNETYSRELEKIKSSLLYRWIK
ncbi:MAG: CDP-glycerol glycerophosphotransferase family protein [Nitrospinae bacterium]|nr:CDP-glycerol glycerophosphotransferase family protein [Nitrospinota bacterium]